MCQPGNERRMIDLKLDVGTFIAKAKQIDGAIPQLP
jgi:hypothetical protein